MERGRYIRTPKTLEKMSITAKKQIRIRPSIETRKKISASMKGNKNGKGLLGTKKTDEHKRNLSVARSKQVMPKGEKAFAWKGGVTPINKRIRSSKEYRLWREAVLERDGYACIWGGIEHGTLLEVDHIKPFAYFPELRFAIDNGRTLCRPCHKTTSTYGNNKYLL